MTTVIIIFKLRIWRTHNLTYTQCIHDDWMTTVIIIFKLRMWRTHSVSMMTKWPPLSLFSNYAFDVHTVYQWWLNDHRYHYFQTTHLTYTQCINDDWMTAVIIIFKLRIWRTHSVSMMTEWMTTVIIIFKLRIWRHYFQTTYLTYTQYKNMNYTYLTYTVMSMITHRYKQSSLRLLTNGG